MAGTSNAMRKILDLNISLEDVVLNPLERLFQSLVARLEKELRRNLVL